MTTYYWNASTGNDANDGSVGAPFKTFGGANPAAALAALAPGDIVDLTGAFIPDVSSSAAFNAFVGLRISSKSDITIGKGINLKSYSRTYGAYQFGGDGSGSFRLNYSRV